MDRKEERLSTYKKEILDTKSASFCGAKWYNATIWLGNGMTTSCHHPPAHKVPLEELELSYKALHNTKHKKAMRKMMQEGKRPPECDYCWKLEDMGEDTVSDRVFKSIIYKDEDLQKAFETDWQEDIELKTLEIAFDNTCNLACSYCNPSFSTVWVNDIKSKGHYKLISDGGAAFMQDGSWVRPYESDEDNPYIQAFWKWWDDSLSKTLTELRLTGGEPLLNQNTWKLLDWFVDSKSSMRFAINSNLMVDDKKIDKLIEQGKHVKKFKIYTSCEATGKQAEYIRHNLDYEHWTKNMYRLLTDLKVGLHIMMTINSLCLFSITDFLDDVYKMKETVGSKNPTVSLNLLRFPSFQSPLALPDHIKDHLHEKLSSWYEINKDKKFWSGFEKASIERLIDYLVTVDAPHRRTSNKIVLWRDFKLFYEQYDKRRNKSISVFPKILTDWIKTIPDTDFSDAELAKKEGWQFKPKPENM